MTSIQPPPPPQPQQHGISIMKKRPLHQPNLRLTHIQWIDCVQSSTTGSTGSHAASTSSSSAPRYNSNYQARSVSWNTTGSLLAVGCSDATIRFWNPAVVVVVGDTNNVECGSLHTLTTTTTTNTTGSTTTSNTNTNNNSHSNLPMIAATFHPTSDPILCSMTAGSGTLRLWDVRTHTPSVSATTATATTGTTSTTGNANPTMAFTSLSQCPIGLHRTCASSSAPLPIVVAVEWNPIQTHFISCTTHDGRVSIYDTRKFTNTTTTTTTASSTTSSALVRTIQFPDQDRIESCRFDPLTGEYLLAGVTNRRVHCGMGYIKAATCGRRVPHHHHHPPQWYSYPAHAGPIYTMASRLGHGRRHTGGDGIRATMTMTTTNATSPSPPHVMATGGSDAVVAIWDASTMTCTSTISSRTKFIRSLAFSHPHHENDPLLLAIATEEDVIELIDCSNVGVATGGSSGTASIGLMPLSNSSHTANPMRRSMPTAGAEDICFHPTIPNLLACARTSEVATSSSGMSSVTLLKFTTSSS